MNVAFIPVRGGSKSIPLKNIKPLCGKPLVFWVVRAACSCEYIDKVFVSTDSLEIKLAVEDFKSSEPLLFDKLNIVGRSPATASDTASTESAMLEFAEKHTFDNIVLIQATSPLLTPDDLNNGFEVFFTANTDSVLSVVRQKRFNWDKDNSGIAHPLNYDVFNRPRRQEFDGYFVENGAFYITSRKALLSSKNRISGKIRVAEMPEDSFFEIDEPDDWIIIEALMRKRECLTKKDLNKIKLFLTDCDGCLTDGGMYYSEKGDEIKKFNTKDGMAFSLLKKHGILVGMITGETVELNRRRAEKLSMDFYVPGCTDKVHAVEKICRATDLSFENVLFVGDDINDIKLMRKVGYSCCPKNAVTEVKSMSDYISSLNGGEGVIREITDYLLSHIS